MALESEQADRVEIFKSARRLEMWRGANLLAVYRVALGFAPVGHKEREGDGRTPEGNYSIDARNPRSRFHLSLRVSYPEADDRERAVRLGVPPGGDIYIHGKPNGWRRYLVGRLRRDWTTGCIAVSDSEIREIWSRLPTGARVVIRP